MPPIPEDASELLKDFLEQCFHKDPTQRPSAEVLCEHAWLKNTWVAFKVCLITLTSSGLALAYSFLQELCPQESIPFLRRISTALNKPEVVRYFDTPHSPVSESPKRIEEGKAIPITRRTSAPLVCPFDNDFAPREHVFVKTVLITRALP